FIECATNPHAESAERSQQRYHDRGMGGVLAYRFAAADADESEDRDRQAEQRGDQRGPRDTAGAEVEADAEQNENPTDCRGDFCHDAKRPLSGNVGLPSESYSRWGLRGSRD